MKIRIKGNSVRLRLTKPEVDIFAGKKIIFDETNFGGGQRLKYALSEIKDGLELTAGFENNCITVYMPAHLQNIWTTTETVGFEANMPMDNGDKLFILVEKDWKCIDGSNEDQSDMYENPNEELLK